MPSKINRDILMRLLTVLTFSLLTSFGIIFFLYLFFTASSFYTYILAFAYMALILFSGFFNIFTSYSYYRSYFYDEYLRKIKEKLLPVTEKPTVAIVMTTFNENTAVVKRNLLQLMRLKYPRQQLRFYLLDDSTDKEKASEMELFSKQKRITYIHRDDRKDYKAGALNNMLKYSKEKFIAIFDYDEHLVNFNFLNDLLPYFSDPKLSYIQTEKQYSKGNFFSDTVNLFDAFFFKFIQPSRALNNTAIFAGSCGMIRREHLNSIGGFPSYVTEDTFFSFESDVKGFKSLYIPAVYALGKPIMTFTELVKQQWRYNYGDTQFIGYFFNHLRKKDKRKQLSPLSRIDYFTHGMGLNYISVIIIVFTVLSILITFSQFPITNLKITDLLQARYVSFDLEVIGLAALVLSIATPMFLAKMYFNSFRKGFMMFLLNFALAFIRAKAALSAIFNSSQKIIWDHIQPTKGYGRLIYAVRNSVMESSFSVLLIILGLSAVALDNAFGAFWLLWYGVLYISTLFMFYKYG